MILSRICEGEVLRETMRKRTEFTIIFRATSACSHRQPILPLRRNSFSIEMGPSPMMLRESVNADGAIFCGWFDMDRIAQGAAKTIETYLGPILIA